MTQITTTLMTSCHRNGTTTHTFDFLRHQMGNGLACPMGGSGPPSNTWFHKPTRDYDISNGSTIFAQSTLLCLHLVNAVMWLNDDIPV